MSNCRLIEGKIIAEAVNRETAAEAETLSVKAGRRPCLAVVLVGADPASQVYVSNKVKKCRELGFESKRIDLPCDVSTMDVLDAVGRLNADAAVDGILVQSPPPPQVDERLVVEAIDPRKDVDCFHPLNVGRLMLGDTDGFPPCTPAGVVELLLRSGVDTRGRHAVVIGRSNIVGKPLAVLLARKGAGGDATVTLCHSRTVDLPAHVRRADIVVAAIGKANFVTADMVKDGAVVIDVGINRIPCVDTVSGHKLVGDVAFDEVRHKASLITPVPGGVGPMTIAMLIRNTLKAFKSRIG